MRTDRVSRKIRRILATAAVAFAFLAPGAFSTNSGTLSAEGCGWLPSGYACGGIIVECEDGSKPVLDKHGNYVCVDDPNGIKGWLPSGRPPEGEQ